MASSQTKNERLQENAQWLPVAFTTRSSATIASFYLDKEKSPGYLMWNGTSSFVAISNSSTHLRVEPIQVVPHIQLHKVLPPMRSKIRSMLITTSPIDQRFELCKLYTFIFFPSKSLSPIYKKRYQL